MADTGIGDRLTWPAEDYSRVPYRVFTDPAIYQREQELIFRGPTWSYLGLDAEISNPGDYKSTFLGDTPVVVVRAADGELSAFVNRCAHRGTLLVRDLLGNASDFTCIYHHWCYDLEGNLIGVPFLRGLKGKGGMPSDFDMADHGLRQLRVGSRSGVIFATSDETAEDLDAYLGKPMLAFLNDMFGRPIDVLGYMRQRTYGNWKLYFENLKDPYHAGLLHQFQTTFGIYRNTLAGGTVMDERHRHAINSSFYNSDDAETIAEGYDDIDVLDESLTLEDHSIVEFHDEIGDRKVANMMHVFPSVQFGRLANCLATRHIRPKSADEFELYWTIFGYADDTPDLRAFRMRQINLVGPGGLVSMEDSFVGALVQQAIGREGDYHSVIEMGGVGPVTDQDTVLTEVPVRGMWRYYCELMGLN